MDVLRGRNRELQERHKVTYQKSCSYSGRCTSEFHLFLRCNNPLAFHQHDDKFGHGHHSSRSGPWTQQISHKISIDLVPLAHMRRQWWAGQSGASVWISWVISSYLAPCGQRHGIDFASSAPFWSQTLRETLFPVIMWRREQSSFGVVVFNRWYPHSSWVSLLISLTRGRPWDGILRYSSNLRYLPVRTPTTRQPNNEFKIYRPDIVWHYFYLGLRWQFSYNGSTQLNVIGTNGTHCIWHNWRNHHSPGKGWPEEGTGIIQN